MTQMILRIADLTTLDVDAIVNAANPALLGGGGVDGAIHSAAGPGLLRACRALPEVEPGVRCPTGEARVTPGFGLHARWVVHAVGPIWRGGHANEVRLLAACYRNSMLAAAQAGARSVAFPAISCGVYGYPYAQAAHVALAALRACVGDVVTRVLLCPRTHAGAAHYRVAAAALDVALVED